MGSTVSRNTSSTGAKNSNWWIWIIVAVVIILIIAIAIIIIVHLSRRKRSSPKAPGGSGKSITQGQADLIELLKRKTPKQEK